MLTQFDECEVSVETVVLLEHIKSYPPPGGEKERSAWVTPRKTSSIW